MAHPSGGVRVEPDKKVRIGVLISGSGTDLQSIIDAIEDGYITEAEIAVVISNKADAYGLERARQHGISAVFIEFRKRKRIDFDMEMIDVLERFRVDLVVMAGFMRLVTSHFVNHHKGRLINIHPALLPSFPGTHAHRDALAYGVKVSGCTIHFVDEEMDHGPIIMQQAVKVDEGETEDTLGPKVLAHEHNLLPKAVKLWCRGALVIDGRYVRVTQELPGYKEWLSLRDGKAKAPPPEAMGQGPAERKVSDRRPGKRVSTRAPKKAKKKSTSKAKRPKKKAKKRSVKKGRARKGRSKRR